MTSSRHIRLGMTLAILAGLTVAASTAYGHYLWVSVDGSAGKQGAANLYFEESAAPGNGEYLDQFIKNGKTWIRTIANPKPTPIAMKDTKQDKLRWLKAELPEGAPRSIDSYSKFGVYRYGKTDVLLHYYARFLQVDSHEEMHELGRAEQLDLDIVPHNDKDQVELTILWKGKPAVDSIVYLRGPKNFAENPKTDQEGKVRFSIKDAGKYVARTNVELATAGQDNGEDYSLIRHHATLILSLPLKE